jgi:hypothetical protein
MQYSEKNTASTEIYTKHINASQMTRLIETKKLAQSLIQAKCKAI